MKRIFYTIEEMPITLNADEVAQVLGVSRAGAYNLLNSTGFPTLHIGSRKIVPRDKFVEWINKNSGDI
jgi:predicted DNA-binding transcriptional regulator AlpA